MSDLDKKFSIESGSEGFVISKGVDNQIQATEEELLNELVELSDSFLTKIQDRKLAKKKEQYAQLKPAGFKYASENAKKYRQKLENFDDIEQMKYLQEILVYKSKETILLPTINKFFRGDLNQGTLEGGNLVNKADAIKLAQSKGYRFLFSDWEQGQSEAQKQSTNWCKLEKLFGKYADQGALFSMLGFHNLYYRDCSSSERNGEKRAGVLLYKILTKNHFLTNTSYEEIVYRACAFRNSK